MSIMRSKLGGPVEEAEARDLVHICHFYQSADDLAETLVPWFRDGIAQNQGCVWVTADPLRAAEARSQLRAAVSDLEAREAAGQIAILDQSQFYNAAALPSIDALLQGWFDRAAEARARGRSGLRVTGNLSWIDHDTWEAVMQYEASVTRAFQGHGIQAICSYPLQKFTDEDVCAIVGRHQASLLRRSGAWDLVANPFVLAPGEVDAAAVAKDVAGWMMGMFGSAGILLRVRADESVVGRWDRQALERILVELLSNTVAHAGARLVELDVIPAGRRVVIAVKDHGQGLDDGVHRKLLDLRGPPRAEEGLQFGLWVTRRIVEALGGTLRIASAEGSGTTFFVVLPR